MQCQCESLAGQTWGLKLESGNSVRAQLVLKRFTARRHTVVEGPSFLEILAHARERTIDVRLLRGVSPGCALLATGHR